MESERKMVLEDIYIYIRDIHLRVVNKYVPKYSSQEGTVLLMSDLFSNIPIENKYSTLKIHLYYLHTQPMIGLPA